LSVSGAQLSYTVIPAPIEEMFRKVRRTTAS
jgi:hypothetical protein